MYLTDSGPVRFSHVEEHPFSLLRPPEKAGTFRVSPSEFLRVELKQVPLGFQGSSFRSAKSFDLTRSGVSAEFPGPFVRIERIVATGRETTRLKEPHSPALLISFSPTALRIGESPSSPRTLHRGNVLWIESRQVFGVASPDGTAAGHVLQIIFLPKT